MLRGSSFGLDSKEECARGKRRVTKDEGEMGTMSGCSGGRRDGAVADSEGEGEGSGRSPGIGLRD